MANLQRSKVVEIRKLIRRISDGELQLPQFQRQEAWPGKTIRKFLMAVCKQRPLGVFLLVSYDSAKQNSQLTPRNFSDIETPLDDVKELLLDGQQRLTALWKVFNDGYPEKIYCVRFTTEEDGTYCKDKIEIESMRKKKPSGDEDATAYMNLKKYPQRGFCSDKSKKLIPLDFFNPDQTKGEWDARVGKWLSAERLNQVPEEIKESLKQTLDGVWRCFREASAPRFLLPGTMTPDEVISIFIDINTGAKSLTHYDIAVADIEKETGKYIEKELAEPLRKKIPDIERIDKDDAGELAMKVACVLNNKPPSGANYLKLKPYGAKIFDKKEDICDGLEWAVRCLNELKIYRKQQLPSSVPLRVLPALYPAYQEYVKGKSTAGKSARIGEADKMIKRYIWHAFLTNMYTGTGTQVNERLLDDYKKLKLFFDKSLGGKATRTPSFNATPIDLKQKQVRDEIEWPAKEGIWARGILIACMQDGGKDPVSGKGLDANKHSKDVHYHHVFAKDRLKKISSADPDLALNCLFISGPSNIDFKNHLPGTYLENIWEDPPKNGRPKIERSEVQQHLETHLINEELFNDLIKVKGKTHGGEKNKDELLKAYRKFIKKRAKLVDEKIKELLK